MSKVKLPRVICELLDEEGTASGVLRRILNKENSDPKAAMRWLEDLIAKDPLRFIYSLFYAIDNDYEVEEEKKYYLVNEMYDDVATGYNFVNINVKEDMFFFEKQQGSDNYKTIFTKTEWERYAEKFGLVIAPGKFELVEVKR